MGYVAAIGAVASLVASGVSAYSSSQKGGAPGAPPKVNLQGVSLPGPAQAAGDYAQQAASIPGMESTASAADLASNQEYQKNLTSVDPDLMKQIGQIGSLATSYLNGQIPQDVQDQIQRSTAQQAQSGGYGGTQMARNLTARDLGLTSMNLQQTGATLAGTGQTMAAAVNPSYTPVSSLLFSPAQLQARSDQANYYNTDIKNQQAIMNSGNALAAQMAASTMGMKNTANTNSAIQSGVKSLFGSGATSGSSGGLLGGIMKMFGGSGSGSGTSTAADSSGSGGLYDSADPDPDAIYMSSFGSDLSA